MSTWPLSHRHSEADRGKPRVASAGEILVVESDFDARHEIVEYLTERQLRAVAAFGRDDLLKKLRTGEPRLLILDLQSGRNNGLNWLREVRSCSEVPVITTGRPCDEIDPLIGFEIGADDYLRKPFGLRELLARIRAILRRKSATRSADAHHLKLSRYRFRGWHLCQRTRCLTNPYGSQVSLSKSEYALLVAFLNAPQRPLSRLALCQATRIQADINDRSMDVRILRLRRKLRTGPDGPCLIKTERGVGYVFVSPVERFDQDDARGVK
jgi:two-component system OmpR family response regulator